MNALCNALRIRIPIVQAPTGSIAGPELAAAVSNAGALGSMGFTWTDAESARSQVAQALSLTRSPFAVNFVHAFYGYPLVEALESGASIITFSWGTPTDQIELCRTFGARVGIQIGTLEGAQRALDADPDFIICQGIEAGGHVESIVALDRLLDTVLTICNGIPIVAAGGIADGQGIARVMKAGAQGAMLGTRYVATQESRAHEAYKRRLLDADSDQTVLTSCFDGGWPIAPHRVLRNCTLDAWESAGCPPSGKRPGEAEVTGFSATGEPILRYENTAPRTGMTGAVEEMALYSGTGVGQITDIPSAGELAVRLWEEARYQITESTETWMDKRS